MSFRDFSVIAGRYFVTASVGGLIIGIVAFATMLVTSLATGGDFNWWQPLSPAWITPLLVVGLMVACWAIMVASHLLACWLFRRPL